MTATAADWQKLNFEFETAAQHGWTPTVFFKAQLGKTGAVFLDDVSVTRISSAKGTEPAP
jgi:hypothetical protein